MNYIENASVEFVFEGDPGKDINESKFVIWVRENILEAIDKISAELISADELVQIPEMNIELELNLTGGELPAGVELKNAIQQQINVAIRNCLAGKQTTKVPLSEHKANVILEYLRTGLVEKYYRKEEWKDLLEMFRKETSAGKSLNSELLKVLQFRGPFSRFYVLYDREQLAGFLEKLAGEKRAEIFVKALQQIIEENPPFFKSISGEELFYEIFRLLPEVNFDLIKVLQAISRNQQRKKPLVKDLHLKQGPVRELANLLNSRSIRNFPEIAEPLISEVEPSAEVLEEGAYCGQPGLVVIAAFLPEFLKKTGYINQKGELRKQKELPMLLHYLATGETTAMEWELTLPKILSGLKPGQHCDKEIKPGNELNEKINELLTAVIAHWPQLKNTGPLAFRETFLRREGHLKMRNGFYYLYIKENTIDILLTFLSWNINTIRLQWMQHIIFVEWNHNN